MQYLLPEQLVWKGVLESGLGGCACMAAGDTVESVLTKGG